MRPKSGGRPPPKIAASATGASSRRAATEAQPSRLSQLVRHWVKAPKPERVRIAEMEGGGQKPDHRQPVAQPPDQDACSP